MRRRLQPHAALPNGIACDSKGLCTVCTKDTDCTTKGFGKCNTTTGACVQCLPAADTCPAGSYCSGTTCATPAMGVGCKVDGDCGSAAQACCNHVCTIIDGSDGKAANCGACNRACGTSGGTVPAPLTCCAGVCADLTSDSKNCSACGTVCSFANGFGLCQGSSCQEVSCDATHIDCNGDQTDGCETDITVDPNNCTGCGKKCTAPANSTAVCSSGCQVSSCTAGFADCNGTFQDGCEINPKTTSTTAAPAARPARTRTGPTACTDGVCGLSRRATPASPTAIGTRERLRGEHDQHRSNNCGSCGNLCNGVCKAGVCIQCNGFPVVGSMGTTNFCKVQVSGQMTDNNILTACLIARLNAPCQGSSAVACTYNDGFCKPNTFETCATAPVTGGSTVMKRNLGTLLCPGMTPDKCTKLYDVFQYMGNNLAFGQQGCGVVWVSPSAPSAARSATSSPSASSNSARVFPASLVAAPRSSYAGDMNGSLPLKTGLVLSGGGARGAYEVGVLCYLREELPKRLGFMPRLDVVSGAFRRCHQRRLHRRHRRGHREPGAAARGVLARPPRRGRLQSQLSRAHARGQAPARRGAPEAGRG